MKGERAVHYDDLPTSRLDGDIWVQCQLRMTFRLQADLGFGLRLCNPRRQTLRISLGEVMDHVSSRAIYNGMLQVESDSDFQDEFSQTRTELDHLEPDHADRVAYNQAMDARWDEIRKSAEEYCHPKLYPNV